MPQKVDRIFQEQHHIRASSFPGRKQEQEQETTRHGL